MALVRTLLRLHGGGLRPPGSLWSASRSCSTEAVEDTEPVQYDLGLIQGRACRPLRKAVTLKGKSRVLRALAGTWTPLTRPLAPKFRALTDPLVHEASVEEEIDRLGEEAAAFMARYNDQTFNEPFPWKDVRKAPADLGQRLMWYVDRLNVDEADATRQEIMSKGKMTQHLENCWLDARLSWVIIESEIKKAEEADSGTPVDLDEQALLEEELRGNLRSAWKEVAMKDAVTYGLYAAALSHVGLHKRATNIVQTAHQEGVQVPRSTYSYMLEVLPKSWEKSDTHPEDTAKVEDVLSILELMTTGPFPVQPDADLFQKACSALHCAGNAGAIKIFHTMAEMDHCRIEPTLGTYYYIFIAAVNHMGRPEIISDIVDRLSTTGNLHVRSETDLHFMNLALQHLATNRSTVSAAVARDAAKLINLAKSVNYRCVQDRAGLVNDYMRVLSYVDNVTTALVVNAVEMVEDAIKDGAYLSFNTFAVLGALSQVMGPEYPQEMVIRSWSALKKQLVMQQFNIIFPVKLFYKTQLRKAALGGAVIKNIEVYRFAQMPLMDGWLEEFQFFDSLMDAYKSFPIQCNIEATEVVEAHTSAMVTVMSFKKAIHTMVLSNTVREDVVKDVMQVLKEVCVLQMGVGGRLNIPDIRVLGELSVRSGMVDQAVAVMCTMVDIKFTPPMRLLNQLTYLVMQRDNSEQLLSMLAVTGSCGMRLPVTTYQEIGAKYPRHVLLTALWLSENTPARVGSGRDLTSDLMRVWPHVLETIKGRRDGIDEFLAEQDMSVTDESSRNLKKLFEGMTIKKKLSPLDLVEKETPNEIVEVFDAGDDEDLLPSEESLTKGQIGEVLAEAQLDQPEYRGGKSFHDPRKGY